MQVVGSLSAVVSPDLPSRLAMGGSYAVPSGTLWARNRTSDAAAVKVRLAHVDQGFLNDCFLNAVMGALALQQPQRIERMVRDRGDHIDVSLPGRTVHLGRELPMVNGRPIFSGHGGNNVLWSSYIEKAVAATMRDGYGQLDRGGDVREAFEWLLGNRPRQTTTPGGSILGDIRDRLRAGEAVVVGTYRTPTTSRRGREMAELGVHADHAYVATSVYSRGGTTYLRLWNIWGYEHPKVLTEDQVRRLVSEVVSDASWYYIPDALD